MAATSSTDVQAPMTFPSGCETTKSATATVSTTMARGQPAKRPIHQAQSAPPMTSTTPPMARLPVNEATAKPRTRVNVEVTAIRARMSCTIATMDVELAAAEILQARRAGRCLDAATLPIDEHMAYAVQHVLTGVRESNGEHPIGWKLGYTSEAMRRQMGVAEPNYGPLTDAMLLADGATVPNALQPKVEPEIALVIERDVPSPLTANECRAVVRSAHLALEVVDSVWRDYRFTWAHNTADGSSAAFVVLGPMLAADNLADVDVELLHNGDAVGHGRGSAAMGDPFTALAWLTSAIAAHPRGLRAGDVVITGGLCAATALRPGDTVMARTTDGDVAVSVRG